MSVGSEESAVIVHCTEREISISHVELQATENLGSCLIGNLNQSESGCKVVKMILQEISFKIEMNM